VQIGLSGLFGSDAAAHIDESEKFYAARGDRRGPTCPEEVLELRAGQARAGSPGGADVEQVSDSLGRRVTVRIHRPTRSTIDGVLLDIPAVASTSARQPPATPATPASRNPSGSPS
jgi:hypothetical protein